jgi:uncharacterized protein (TIGR03437 family)
MEGVTPQAGGKEIYGSVQAGTKTPLVSPGALVHGASFVAGAPVAPGGLITIYGQNLAERDQEAGRIPLPVELDGTQVLLGGQPMPLLYSSAGQINAQAPYALPANTQHQVVVRRGTTQSVPEEFTVATAQPGIFTTNRQGFGQGVILRSDQRTLAQPGTPAARGEVIVIYCAGLGPVEPRVEPGQPAPVPAARTVNPVSLLIGSKTAQVVFAGLTPGFAGLYQVNAVVPQDAQTGDAVPVTLSVAGQVSPVVTMAVK